jgi:hypothetical protein
MYTVHGLNFILYYEQACEQGTARRDPELPRLQQWSGCSSRVLAYPRPNHRLILPVPSRRKLGSVVLHSLHTEPSWTATSRAQGTNQSEFRLSGQQSYLWGELLQGNVTPEWRRDAQRNLPSNAWREGPYATGMGTLSTGLNWIQLKPGFLKFRLNILKNRQTETSVFELFVKNLENVEF